MGIVSRRRTSCYRNSHLGSWIDATSERGNNSARISLQCNNVHIVSSDVKIEVSTKGGAAEREGAKTYGCRATRLVWQSRPTCSACASPTPPTFTSAYCDLHNPTFALRVLQSWQHSRLPPFQHPPLRSTPPNPNPLPTPTRTPHSRNYLPSTSHSMTCAGAWLSLQSNSMHSLRKAENECWRRETTSKPD